MECKVTLYQMHGCDSYKFIFLCALEQYLMGQSLTDHEGIPFDNMHINAFLLEYI